MKSVIAISLILCSLTTFARMKRRWFTYKVYAPTELEVLQKAQDAIPLIQYGKLRADWHDRDCWPNNKNTIKISGVTTSKAYKYVNGELEKYYIGKVKYLHKRCRDH